jgi:hemoglobin/transferrin/lactoferrin receptor protein
VNNFFENPAQGYRSLPNPDLRPETSRTFEGGVRYAGEIFSVGVTAFHSKYKNFIEQIETTGLPFPNPPTNYWLYQWVNISGAEISGIEARGDLNLANGITGRFAAAYAKGDQILAGGAKSPLMSVDPVSLVGGLGYRDPGGTFGGEMIVTHNARKPLDRTAGCTPQCYRPASFTIVDATAFVRIADLITLRAGVFNIFDEKYSYWSDVRGLASTSTVTDAYTRPGRNASASVTLRF